MSFDNFRDSLDRLGLSQYHDGFVSEAFDSWPVLAEITESDMDALGVKLGHRRILQRAIGEFNKLSSDPGGAEDSNSENADTSRQTEGWHRPGACSAPMPARAKRKYVRHPKPDENAPSRPPSAYVLFSNHTREKVKAQNLSFTDIAKTVGERWQILPAEEKDIFETKSQTLKDKYRHALTQYKKTREYAKYQQYLVDFRAKQDALAIEKHARGHNKPGFQRGAASHGLPLVRPSAEERGWPRYKENQWPISPRLSNHHEGNLTWEASNTECTSPASNATDDAADSGRPTPALSYDSQPTRCLPSISATCRHEDSRTSLDGGPHISFRPSTSDSLLSALEPSVSRSVSSFWQGNKARPNDSLPPISALSAEFSPIRHLPPPSMPLAPHANSVMISHPHARTQ